MAYVHLRRRIPPRIHHIDILTPHGVRFRLQFQQLTTLMGSDCNWGSQSVSAGVIKPLQLQRSIYMHKYVLVGCKQRMIKILMPNLSQTVKISQNLTCKLHGYIKSALNFILNF